MHQWMRILAVGSLISLSSLIGWAKDPAWSEDDSEDLHLREPAAKSPAGMRSPSLSGLRKRSSVSQETMPRNYYQELFSGGDVTEVQDEPAEKQEKQVDAIQKYRQGMQSTPTKTATATVPPRSKNQVKVPLKDFAEDSEVDWPSSKSEQVQQAEFDDQLDRGKSKVHPVRVEVRPKSSRIPVPPRQSHDTTLTSAVGAAIESSPVSHAPAATLDGPQTASISLQWVKKSELNVGQEGLVELVVKNIGTLSVDQVVVDVTIQTPVRLTSAKPQPVEQRDRLTWNLSSLSAGSEQRISLKMIPSRRGDLGLAAQVRTSNNLASAFRVEEPLLKVALKGPTEILLGESASQMVTVSNPGTGAAHDVKITAHVSNGLESGRGTNPVIEMDIGTIMAGESRTVRLPLTGTRGGEQAIQVTANSSSSSELSNVVNAAVHVISPSLSVTAEGPALRYKGRNARFLVNVTNDGSVPNNNVRVTQSVADGFQFVSADHGGQFDSTQQTISWFLGRLEPEQSIQVECELAAVGLGEFTQTVWATSDAGARAETTIDTQVDGTPSLTMQVVDLDDPVEIGLETAYEVRVKNEGSKSATNVAVHCEIPAGVELLSAKGPTDASKEKRTVLFKPVPQLSPGQELVFRVYVKGMHPGDHRIKALVSSDSLEEPLLKEEQTKFYSDSRR